MGSSVSRRATLLLAPALVAGCAMPAAERLHRLEQTLGARDSATAALQSWCADRRFADPARIVAQPVHDAERSEPAGLRPTLAITAAEPLGYRHVRLACGAKVLSEAHNWYVPSRLTPSMNEALATTDTPFGTVVAPLHFHRERLQSMRGPGAECPKHTVLSHRALLRLPDGTPLALLVECYTHATIAD